jgi:pyruvate formate lyase activating enzyme
MLDGVVITGGEPTMHDDLLDFMRQIKEEGFDIKLDSNGTNPEALQQAIDRKLVDYIAMDIKAPLARYSNLVARPVDISALARSIELIMSSPVDYEFRTTVVKALLSPQELMEIGKEIEGARRYFLQKFVPTKLLNPQFRKKATYNDAEFENIRNVLSNYVQYCEVR